MPLSLRLLACSFCVVALLLAAPLAAQEELVDSALGFTLKIPAGFKPEPEVVKANPQIAHAYFYEHPEDGTQNIMLFIEKMRGTIGRERLDASKLPPGVNAKLFVTQWQGYEVDAVDLAEENEELKLTTYNIQIPLKKFAIQLKLSSQPQNKAELDRVLRYVLDNLQGESNWATTTTAPAGKQDPNNNYGKFLLACAIILIVIGIVLFFVISRRTNPGTVLALAVVIWLVGGCFGGNESREGLMVCGSLKMLGFIGIILGIIDLVRGRKTMPPPLGE